MNDAIIHFFCKFINSPFMKSCSLLTENMSNNPFHLLFSKIPFLFNKLLINSPKQAVNFVLQLQDFML